MEKLHMILLMFFSFVQSLFSQGLIEQIEKAYDALDSVSYIENVIISYKKNLLGRNSETEFLKKELHCAYDSMDSIEKQKVFEGIINKYHMMELIYKENLLNPKIWEEIANVYGRKIATAYSKLDGTTQKQREYDSILRDFSKISMERDYSVFVSAIKNKPAYYILNLVVKDQLLQVDTSELPFNLFYFDKEGKESLYVYCEKGRYSWQNSNYTTFSKQTSKNAPKAFRKIIKKTKILIAL